MYTTPVTADETSTPFRTPTPFTTARPDTGTPVRPRTPRPAPADVAIGGWARHAQAANGFGGAMTG